LTLGAVVKANHEFRQSNPEYHSLHIAKCFPERVSPEITLKIYC